MNAGMFGLPSGIDPSQSPGANGLAVIYYRQLLTSQTILLPPGLFDIIAIGAGGSGAARTDYGNSGHRSTGGGAGGYVRHWGVLDSATAVSCTPGAGGAAQTVTTPPASVNGLNGGNTVVSGKGIYLFAGGGLGGVSNTTATATNGGAGGVAFGGTQNYAGGRGGRVDSVGAVSFATGGGAVNIFGLDNQTGTSGGDVPVGAASAASTGGGGCGGPGGYVSGSFAAGGGAGGPASGNTKGPDITGGFYAAALNEDNLSLLSLRLGFGPFFPFGEGGLGTSASPGNAPRGGGGGSYFGTTGGNFSGNSAGLGGSGAGYAFGNTVINSGTALYGGGTGGIYVTNGSGGPAGTASKAGDGLVLVRVYKRVS